MPKQIRRNRTARKRPLSITVLWCVVILLCSWLAVNELAARLVQKPKQPHPSDALFATNAPIYIFNIEVSGPALEALTKENRVYARGTVRVGTNAFKNIGVHLKGNGSFRPLNEKPSLVVKFDRYVADQEFCGLTKISLNSSSQDSTYLADFVANSLFQDAGVPVSRVTHARVKFNGRDLGLYVLVEMHNKEFLKRWFHNAHGNLYEAYLADVNSQMDQDNGLDETQKDRKHLVEVLKIPDAAERWSKLQQVLDVDRYVSHLVCEIFTSHVDGYAMNLNNYRIYDDPDTGRFTFLGHGVDWGFANTGVSIKPPQNSLVAKAVLTTREGDKLFKERFGTLFTNVFRLEVLTNRVHAAVGRLLAHAISPNETNEFLGYGVEMNNRLVARWQNITNQFYSPQPIPLAFDDHGIAKLTGWRKKVDRTSVTPSMHEQAADGSHHALHIACTNGPCVASWRTKVSLPPGHYSFEGNVRGAGIIAHTNSILGVGIRISGGKRTNDFVIGDAPWKPMRYAIKVENVEQDVELVCELRAMKGEVWFDEDSLRLVRGR